MAELEHSLAELHKSSDLSVEQQSQLTSDNKRLKAQVASLEARAEEAERQVVQMKEAHA